MKNHYMIILGIIPLIVGVLINYLMTELNMYGSSITIISIVFLMIWFGIGFTVARTKYDKKTIIFNSLLLSFTNYLIILFQLIVLGRWGFGLLGIITQFYILPTIRFSNYFSSPIGYCTMATLIIIVVYVLGVYTSKQRYNI